MPRALEVVRGLARQVQTLTGVGATDIEARAEGDDHRGATVEAEKARLG